MTTATTTKVTRPMINKILIDAGFTKALWRNRETERLWNNGFLISEHKHWTSLTAAEVRFYIELGYTSMYHFNAEDEHNTITAIAEALNNNGLIAEIEFNSNGKARSVFINKFKGAAN
jgi:hypothetical protein